MMLAKDRTKKSLQDGIAPGVGEHFFFDPVFAVEGRVG